MKKLLLMDAKNYDAALPEFYRIAVRGIILRDNKILLIRSNFNEVKFPGGGIENDESDQETLIRETLEETGHYVIKESIHEFGEVEEKRLSTKETMIWHQISRYYFCEVKEENTGCNYTASEKECGFHPIWLTLEEAVSTNEAMLEKEGVRPWNQREYKVLQLLKEYLSNLKQC